jgi:hypothetical protein
VKYSFIQHHKRIWPTRVQCRVLGVSVSGNPNTTDTLRGTGKWRVAVI